MDKRKSILNVSVSVGFKLLTVVMVMLVKRFLIQACGNEVNGLNAMYLSIIGFLAVAELGVGTAITFCMYKPIVDGDDQKVSALYCLFQKLYRIVGAVILLGGFLLAPFIGHFAKDYAQLNVNLYLTFLLMVLSVALTYLFGAKTALMNAYKNNYITTAITSGGILLQYVLQIIVLIVTKSYVWYLLCRIVATLVQWIVTEVITRRKYCKIIHTKAKIDADTRKDLIKNIKAMFMHNVGYLLVNALDSLVISYFIGVAVLGEYSNYTMVLTQMTAVLKMFFTSLTSVFGHLYAKEGKTAARKYCEAFYLLNFALAAVSFLGYYAVIDDFISLVFAKNLLLSRVTTYVITLNGFVMFLRSNVIVFREATGTFYHDRWKPLLEGVVNAALSILLVHSLGIVGVILATLITSLLICNVIEPYVLYKNAFAASPKRYYLSNYSLIALFACGLCLFDLCKYDTAVSVLGFVTNIIIAVGIAIALCGIAVFMNYRMLKDVWRKLRQR